MNNRGKIDVTYFVPYVRGNGARDVKLTAHSIQSRL